MRKTHSISNKRIPLGDPVFDQGRFHNTRIKVIIPTLNEEKNICDVIHRLHCLGLQDILVIDGHSWDNTAEFARKLGAKILLQNGRGKGSGLREAFKEVLDADVIVMIDADGSMAPEELPSFIDMLDSGADIVKGSRFLSHGNSDDFTAVRRIGNKILTGLTNFLFLTKYTDLCYGYIVFKKKALEKLSILLKGNEFEIETEICIRAKTLGLNVLEVPSHEHARCYGGSNLRSFKDGLIILKMVLTESLRRNRSLLV